MYTFFVTQPYRTRSKLELEIVIAFVHLCLITNNKYPTNKKEFHFLEQKIKVIKGMQIQKTSNPA